MSTFQAALPSSSYPRPPNQITTYRKRRNPTSNMQRGRSLSAYFWYDRLASIGKVAFASRGHVEGEFVDESSATSLDGADGAASLGQRRDLIRREAILEVDVVAENLKAHRGDRVVDDYGHLHWRVLGANETLGGSGGIVLQTHVEAHVADAGWVGGRKHLMNVELARAVRPAIAFALAVLQAVDNRGGQGPPGGLVLVVIHLDVLVSAVGAAHALGHEKLGHDDLVTTPAVC